MQEEGTTVKALYGKNAASPPRLNRQTRGLSASPGNVWATERGAALTHPQRRTRHGLQSPGMLRGAAALTIEENRCGWGASRGTRGAQAYQRHEEESEEPPRSHLPPRVAQGLTPKVFPAPSVLEPGVAPLPWPGASSAMTLVGPGWGAGGTLRTLKGCFPGCLRPQPFAPAQPPPTNVT